MKFACFLMACLPLAAADFSASDAQAFLKRQCLACHQGRAAVAGVNLAQINAAGNLREQFPVWERLLARVKAGEMPPKSIPGPSPKEREAFVTWTESTLRKAVCASDITPVQTSVRRLNRDEYTATLRDLLGIHVNAGQSLPADGAGGEGFDNAGETLFLSPIHAEKYLEAAKQALRYAASDPKARAKLLPTPDARKNIEAFLPRAFRRPARSQETERYMALVQAAQKRGESVDDAVLYAFQGILISPLFLFQTETSPGYAMASRLSYFLWGSMPDEALFDLAAHGKLHDPVVLNEQVARMLKDVKARDFCERFIEQWLNTRELGRDIKPDRTLFPAYYDAELQGAIRYEPVLFFQELLAENESLLNLIDSDYTFLTNKLQKHYSLNPDAKHKLSQQPLHVDLPPGSHRGGVLGMAAVLAVSSYPQRTSPVLRGKWILEAMLGTPPPPPPPNVPALPEAHPGDVAMSIRERLSQHRKDPVCASCHSKIDPLGFALDNYDVLGRYRTEDAGQPIDASGQLPDGTAFNGPGELRNIMLARKDAFIRNLAAKLLGYALGRGLKFEDQCLVDQIVAETRRDGYRAQSLIRAIVQSPAFHSAFQR